MWWFLSKTVRSKVWTELAKQRLGGNQFSQKEHHVHMHEELSEKDKCVHCTT